MTTQTSAQTIPAWVYEQPARAYALVQDLRQENKAFRATANADTERLARANSARIVTVPSAYHSIIPTGYDPRTLADWLDANQGLFK